MTYDRKSWITSLPLYRVGLAREFYETGTTIGPDATLLMVATDDFMIDGMVQNTDIPGKGEMTTALNVFWLYTILNRANIATHFVAAGTRIYDFLPGSPQEYPPDLHLRAIVIKKLVMVPIEFTFTPLIGHKHTEESVPSHANGQERMPEPRAAMRHASICTPLLKNGGESLSIAQIKERHSGAHALAQEAFLALRKYANRTFIDIISCVIEVGHDSAGVLMVGDDIGTTDVCHYFFMNDTKDTRALQRIDHAARLAVIEPWAFKRRPMHFTQQTVAEVTKSYHMLVRLLTGMHLHAFQNEFLR